MSRNTHLALAAALLLVLLTTGCKPKHRSASMPPRQIITVFAPHEVEPIVRAAENIARESEQGWMIDLQIGGAQNLAWRIEDGELPDLYIASTVEMAEELIPRPKSITPWLDNPLVVISRADDPDPILRSPRALERSSGQVAVGGSGTPLGEVARLAMRYADIWPIVERRTTQRTDPHSMIEALRGGEVDLAIVFASDVAAAEPGLFINQTLDLPEGVRVVFTLASYSDLGAEFATYLKLPAPMLEASESGYSPAAPHDDHTD